MKLSKIQLLCFSIILLSGSGLVACKGQFSALQGTGVEVDEGADTSIEGDVGDDTGLGGGPGIDGGTDSFIPEDPASEGTPERPGATNPSIPRDHGDFAPYIPQDMPNEMRMADPDSGKDDDAPAPDNEEEPVNCVIKFGEDGEEIPCPRFNEVKQYQEFTE